MIGLLLAASWYVLSPEILDLPAQHTRHSGIWDKDAPGFNKRVLIGIDRAQAHAMLGGGYFIGIKAQPTESPIGYGLSLEGKPLLNPPRTTSYCSGSSYTAFIEAMNTWMPMQRSATTPTNRLPETTDVFLTKDRFEAMRMQEPDGSRREDHIKFWGHWNADGFGNDFALVQYSRMGKRISPIDARPGDFMNISWKSGLGHSTVFLGWCVDKNGKKAVRYWASQRGTNGMGDQVSPIDSIVDVCVVRLTHPERIYSFNPKQSVDPKVKGDQITW